MAITDNYEKRRLAMMGIILFLLLAGAVIFAYFLNSSKKGPSALQFGATSRPPDPSYPSQIIDLASWKLTLPIISSDSKNGSQPLDIRQPELSGYEMKPWYGLTPDKKGVFFRAPVNAPTTANSDYPRTELREMAATEDGQQKEAFWPSVSGTHTLFLDQAITAVPKNKPDIVAGQIHGDDDDLIVVRLEGDHLFLARGGSDLATLDENYTLGKRFTVRFVARDGKIMVYYNNSPSPVYTLEKEVNEAYFKAGAYTQSNCETEESPGLCSADNYGEAVIYKITVTHE